MRIHNTYYTKFHRVYKYKTFMSHNTSLTSISLLKHITRKSIRSHELEIDVMG